MCESFLMLHLDDDDDDGDVTGLDEHVTSAWHRLDEERRAAAASTCKHLLFKDIGIDVSRFDVRLFVEAKSRAGSVLGAGREYRL
jgi:hypothetical protein